jgi:glycosyltransferase involved in cell wall biosynthesis
VVSQHKPSHETQPPAVSICIPTYKGAAHLGHAIRSVLAQSYRDLELLIIDDNSPDETPDLVASFDDRRIRYLRNPQNLGAEGNWNKCLELARGRYFKLVPQDDALHPSCLEKQVAVLEADVAEELAFVFCARSIVDRSERVIMTRRYWSAPTGTIPARVVVAACVARGTNVIGEPAGVLFRTQLATRVGNFDGSIPYVIDLDYWVRLLAHGAAYYQSESLVFFRISGGSWSVAIGKRQSQEFSRFIDKLVQSASVPLPLHARVSGKIMARLNNGLRLLVYRWLLQ